MIDETVTMSSRFSARPEEEDSVGSTPINLSSLKTRTRQQPNNKVNNIKMENEELLSSTKLDKLDNIPIISTKAPDNELKILDLILQDNIKSVNNQQYSYFKEISSHIKVALYITMLFMAFNFEPVLNIMRSFLSKYISNGMQIILYLVLFYVGVIIILKNTE